MPGSVSAAAPPPLTRNFSVGQLLARVLGRRELLLLVAMIAIAIVSDVHNSAFTSRSNVAFILADAAALAILAVGQAVVLLGRGIDLSVAPVLGLAAVTIGFPAQSHGLALAYAVPIVLAVGAGLGVVNGLLVAVAGLPPIIATLGTLSVYSGLQYVVCDAISPHTVVNIPQSYVNFGGAMLFNGLVYWLTVIAAVIAIVVAVGLRYTRAGRAIYAVGDNADAAFRAGIRVRLTLFSTYVVSGTLAGFAGLIYLVHVGSADPTTGTSTAIELYSIAAALIGGTALTGGKGGAVGSALGAVFLSLALSAMVFAGIDPIWEPAGVGALILVAVVTDPRLRGAGAGALRRGLRVTIPSALRRLRTELSRIGRGSRLVATATHEHVRRRGSDLDRVWAGTLVGILAIELLYFSLSVQGFFGGGTGLLSLSEQFLDIGVIAFGSAFVIFAGEIDLSAGAIASFSGIVMAELWKSGIEIWIAVLLAILITAGLGAINGLIVVLFKVNSLLVTLATQFIITSAATALGGSSPPFGFPQSLLSFAGTGSVGPIPAQLIIFAALAVVVVLLLNRTRFGRGLVLIGFNRDAARYTGVSVSRTLVGAFTLSGALAGIAGIMISAFYNAARDDLALALLLPAITVVVLGGVDIFGGRGRITGVIAATFVLGYVTEGLLVGGQGSLTAQMVTGVVLLFCLVLKLQLDRREGMTFSLRLPRRLLVTEAFPALRERRDHDRR